MDLSQPMVALLLSLCGIASGVFGTWLAFRGKQADQKLVDRQQSYSELADLADARLDEIARKDAHIATLSSTVGYLWAYNRRLLDLYYRHRRADSPDPESLNLNP